MINFINLNHILNNSLIMKPIKIKNLKPEAFRNPPVLNRYFIHLLIIIVQIIVLQNYVLAQTTTPTDTTKKEITSIPIPEITRQATEANSLILEKQKNLLTESIKAAIVSKTDTLLFKISLLREDPRVHKMESLNFRNLSNLESEWSLINSLLLSEQSNLTSQVQKLENEINLLGEMYKVWQNTLVAAEKIKAPDMVIQQIKSTIQKLDQLQSSFQSDSDFLQERLVRVSRGMIFVNEILGKISIAQEVKTKELFELNQPPIWKIFKPKEEEIVFKERRSFINDTVTRLKDFVHTYSFRIWLHLVLFLIILIFIFFSFKNLKDFIAGGNIPQAEAVNKIIRRPISTIILISFLLTYILYENIPESVKLINLIILLVPVLIILNEIVKRKIRRFVYFTVVSVVLIQTHSLLFTGTLLTRVFLMFIILFGLVCLAWILRNKTVREYVLSLRLGKLMYSLATLSFILLSIAILAALAGAVNLAEFITYATINSAALVLIFYSLSLTVNSILIISLNTKSLQKLNVIRQYGDDIYKRTVKIVNIVASILWIILTLGLFNIWDDIYQWGQRVFAKSLSIGTVALSLGNIVVFILVIWLTLWISKLIRIIVEGEVAPKVKFKRGVPGAISLILRITIITIGFLFAIAAAGVDMSKLAILLGALGVGIGFGLQNIFNNLVSGIILAFERPIQVGDIIEIGEFWGTVKEIGIRSSTIFTFEGSEVIVPNGNLISKELINWTLTDRQRRAEVLVGVAYGTDPEKVLNILRNITDEHSEVLKEPAPLALFTGFGNSSLDFRLLFWIKKADERFSIQSEVNVAVNKALEAAGITIPFPQHDLHLKSVDSLLMKDLKGRKGK
jgi:potassium efflux system protein